MSLYRTYRPQSFGDVVGQEHVVTTLSNAVAQDKLAHAYLFAGTRGTGKTSIARILAKHMLTRGMPEGERKEMVLKGVEDGSIVDLTEIDAASNRGIDDVRSLLEKIQFAPAIAASKVFIVDEVHMLTKEAFNALLKTLEEPPPYAYFILATTELHKIPATIQSRCQRFVFRQISEKDIVGRLRYVSDKEKIDIEDEALRIIARHVQGGMRDALSLLDQLRSLPTVTVDDVKERAGESGHEFVEAVSRAIEQSDPQIMLDVVRKMEETAVPFETFARLMLQSVREELHRAVDSGGDTSLWLARMDVMLSALRDLRSAPVPALVMESALLSLCGIKAAMPAAAKSTGEAGPSSPAPRPQAPAAAPKAAAPAPAVVAAPAPVATVPVPAPATAESADGARVEDKWPMIVKDVDAAAVRMSLKNGRIKAIEGDTVVLSFGSSFHKDKVASTEGSRALEEAIAKNIGRPMKIRCVVDGADTPAVKPSGADVDLASEAANIF